jgi:hypothetical protein
MPRPDDYRPTLIRSFDEKPFIDTATSMASSRQGSSRWSVLGRCWAKPAQPKKACISDVYGNIAGSVAPSFCPVL